MTKQELLKIAKPMIVNQQVAKTIENKSQTRRIIKYGYYAVENSMNEDCIEVMSNYCDLDDKNFPKLKPEMIKHSKWKIGDILWIREPVKIRNILNRPRHEDSEVLFEYVSDRERAKMPLLNFERFINNDGFFPKWLRNRQGIPNGCIKEMARHFKRITNVRVERLQNIGTLDKINEGYPKCNVKQWLCGDRNGVDAGDIHYWFTELWDKTAPKGYKWEDNPYVFVYEFETVEYD